MVAGLDIVVGRAAASAGVKAGAWSGRGALSFLQRRKVRKYVANSPSIDDLEKLMSDLDESTQHAIEEFLGSAEFEHIALNLAIALLVESTFKESSRLEKIESELSSHLKLRLIVDSSKIETLSSILFVSLCSATSRFSAEVLAVKPMSPRLRAGLVRTAASAAAASARNKALLDGHVDLRAVEQFEESMRRQVKALYSTMRLPHAGTRRQIPYAKLFVPPEFQREKSSTGDSNPGRTSLSEMVFTSLRPIILGDPGGGKSTLSLKIAADVASGKLVSTKARVPFFVVLREHTKDFRDNSHTLADYLIAACRSPLNLDPSRDIVEYLLLNGRAIVILDGLDELTDTALRGKVSGLVEGFAHLYPNIQIIATSREIGYEQAPLDDELFETFHLAPFTDNQVAEYAKNWFALDENVERNRQDSLTRSFLEESTFASDLRQNPLMLSLMCGIYASERYIPKNRPEIYEKCAVVLFERWDKQRGIQALLPFDAHVRQAMRSLALWLYEEPVRQNGLTRTKLVAFVKSYLLKKRYDDEIEAENAATSFVDFCTGRAWVLTDLGSDPKQSLFGFTHRTFLEYFAASQLVRENSSARALYRCLKARIAAKEWDVVAQLSLQILGQNVEDGSDDFLTLLAKDAAKLTGEAKKNALSFLARSLTFIVPRPDLIRSISDLCMDEFESLPLEEKSSLPDLLIANEENLPGVYRSLIDGVYDLGDALQGARLLPLVHTQEVIEYRRHERGSGIPPHAIEFWRAREQSIRDELSPILERLECSEPWVKLLRVIEGDTPLREFTEAFGLDGLLTSRVAPPIHLLPLCQALLMAMVERANWPTCRPVDEMRLAAELVEVLTPIKPPWFSYSGGAESLWHIDLQEVSESCRCTPTSRFVLAAIYIEFGEQFFQGNMDDRFFRETSPKSGTLSRLLSNRKSPPSRRTNTHEIKESLNREGVEGPFLELLVNWADDQISFVGKNVGGREPT
ncbi:NACHT domain-containing protein [Frankia gtarii]|uniref:NACHT domain-containing protein n=1 Tax=Frankia gtarii TaxID=2950102 RepID=UPI0021BF1711|nr:NACHT domain-containing protein [Frankia gtarii]